MPKIVNHDERKNLIAEAMWRVILDKGMEGATVRNIAEEAGLSLGALRYYFKTQDDLLVYAMDLVQERATKRIEAVLHKSLSPRELVIAMILEIVPVNTTTRIEMEVWFAFITYVKHRSDTIDVPEDQILEMTQRLLAFLQEHRLLKSSCQLEMEIERLYGLIDGLAIHAILNPDRLDPERVRNTIIYHIDSICH
ncbi:TetR/AcrR family transcriptional regulator [Sporosarcina gallistercoris]|uniref:TetR family transcriptional regulator C-terminal domain-containing protein n=1 Tax=Sporosarcina gallistercoris TaxID=2762245 RepID=A0ABR8PK63_9BACL|nr:TetR family transcriptional regulator C-terminal domain-containing protein [Sporosarcina gallistercoris]MBD7908551.1 TetR family transcriptional regulator C-terminal domain-containing protein [Sporosarcina gallistercoris]